MHPADRPRYPTIDRCTHRDRHDSQNARAKGRANTMLAPKLFGSPSELSTPIMRTIPIRYVCRPPTNSRKE